MENSQDHQQAQRLWRQYRSHLSSSERCPDPLQLASYVDGQCPEEDVNILEQHLAVCRTCLETLTLLKEPSCASSEVPPYVLERAKALVAEPTPCAKPVLKVIRPWWTSWDFQWATMAATGLAVCILGFYLGMTVQQTRTEIHQLVLSEMVFGLGEYHGGLVGDSTSEWGGRT